MSNEPVTADTISVRKQVALVRGSEIFDESWYLEQYPDVGLLDMDPAEHYVRFGGRLGRSPGPSFDAAAHSTTDTHASVSGFVGYLLARERDRVRFDGYVDRMERGKISGWVVDTLRPGSAVELELYADGELVMPFSSNRPRVDVGRLGYDGENAGFEMSWTSNVFPEGTELDVRVKLTGNSLKRSPRTVALKHPPMAAAAARYLSAVRGGLVQPVTVLVPVYNALDAVSECLASLAEHLPPWSRVLVIDDCSTQPGMRTLLDRYGDRPRFVVERNAENLGYTRTVNKGIAALPGNDVVLLNSDTVVTERWLHNLRYAVYALDRVATVTALSNNAGAFSVPVIGEENLVPQGMDNAGFARAVTFATTGALLEVPTGNGFCMYMRRSALDYLGAFDERKYPRGYGEENDFCMRAVRAGWRNVVCDKALVFHKRSQSFREEKTALLQAGASQLAQDFPEYKALTRRFRDMEFNALRARIGKAVRAAETVPARRRMLFVISTQTGGTPQTNMDLMRALDDAYDCFLLQCDGGLISLYELVGDELRPREKVELAVRVEPTAHASDQYDQTVADFLYRYSIQLLHIRHIAWHSMNLAEIAQAIGIPVVYSLHDFYSICASHNLLDHDLRYCGGRCTPGEGNCTSALWPASPVPELKHKFIHHWRARFERFFSSCNAFITTASSAAALIESNYPMLAGRVRVIPHGRDFAGYTATAEPPNSASPSRVLIPGNIGPAKGSELIRQMAKSDNGKRFEFHLLGAVAQGLQGVGVQHGRYDRASFSERVAKIRPTLGMILSIWPETYCHTLTEMWSCGIPVLAMDIGAVGDRIRASGAGWLIPPDSQPDDILLALETALADTAGYARRVQAVLDWQAAEGQHNTTAAMSLHYRDVYQGLLDRRSEDLPVIRAQ
ncbi:glycosyltransferase [Luteimonas mephitis]|uniref:glycosyltransferase n=1 Tax=Luteimonas mephitis TaxID=83615 RepID=UPI0004788CEC|nr:glycosyltransferase [Luteimonas mephitis]